MATYYDLILACIPLALLGLGAGLRVAGLDQHAAIAIAGLLTLGLVGHALFVKAPVDPPSPSETAETVERSRSSVSMSD